MSENICRWNSQKTITRSNKGYMHLWFWWLLLHCPSQSTHHVFSLAITVWADLFLHTFISTLCDQTFLLKFCQLVNKEYKLSYLKKIYIVECGSYKVSFFVSSNMVWLECLFRSYAYLLFFHCFDVYSILIPKLKKTKVSLNWWVVVCKWKNSQRNKLWYIQLHR